MSLLFNMKRLFSFIVEAYGSVTRKIPQEWLHGVLCFLTAILSVPFAIGLAIGRESNAFDSTSRLKDSLKDLLIDIGGITLAIIIKTL